MKSHRKSKVVFLLILISFTQLRVVGQVFDVVVAQDGSGDFTTIQAAINKVPINSARRTLIYVKPGTYVEKVKLYSGHKNVSLIGEDVNNVIISWDDYSGDSEGNSTSSSYTMAAEGDGFYAESLTILNTAGNVGQAVALSVLGNEQILKNCRLIGFQDTYYVRKGKQFNLDCYIEGATDFIFGEATSVFQNCEINCVSGGQYITAPADTKLITQINGENFYHGLLFLNCDITSGSGVTDGSYYLGRPWQPNSSSTYIQCTLGDHIKASGWSEWGGNTNHASAHFSEYQNENTTGALVDVSQRVTWSHQLTASQVSETYNLDYFLDGWDPLVMTTALTAPEDLHQNTNNVVHFELNWSPVPNALGYVIIKNEASLGFSETPTFLDPTSTSSDRYRVRSVSVGGSLSGYSEELSGKEVSATVLTLEPQLKVKVKGAMIELEEPVNASVYTLSGSLVFKQLNVQRLDLSGQPQGIYILRMENQRGRVLVKKVAL